MLIKTLQGNRLDIDLDEVYINPCYTNNTVSEYNLCSNQGNSEVIIAKYKDRVIAKHMLHIMHLYSKLDTELAVLREVDLAQDLWLQAEYRLRLAKESYLRKEVK